MTTQKQPKDVPAEGTSPAANPTGATPNGIPDGMRDQDAKGHPTDDRADTETAAGSTR